MNSLGFLSPPLLWGLTLAAIPIIIHLLFRRRFRRVDWAPMHYLKLSIQRNRRRVRIEQLLLLLLRTLLIVLLFLFVARPVLHASGLGKWLGGRSRSSQILVIDDSLGMGYRDGGRSAFDRAKELAVTLLDAIGPKDRFTLLLASQPRQPLLREVELTNHDEAVQLISKLEPADVFVSWEPVVQSLDELLMSGSYPIRDVTLITDLRRAGWDETISPIGTRWSSQQIEMRIFDAGSERTSNVALADLKQVGRLARVGGATAFEAVLHNATESELNGSDATWTVDGKPTQIHLPTIAAGETARIELTATFQEAGLHRVELALADDALLADNRRAAVCSVRDQVNILLVDGEPSSEPLSGEVDFLHSALDIGATDTDTFHVQVVTDSEWATLPAGDSDLIVLANIGSLGQDQITRLERQVAAGTGLMIFPGEQVDATVYTQLLYRDGAGLLPAAPETVADEEFSGLVIEGGAPGPLDALKQLSPAVLERIKVRRYLQVKLAEKEHPDVRVLARWNNAESSPAVIEKTFGRGRVVLWTVTADKLWSDWPTEPSYVLGMREACAATVRSDDGSRQLTAGDALRHELPAGEQLGPPAPSIETPSAEKPQPLRVTDATEAHSVSGRPETPTRPETPATAPDQKTLVFADTQRAGLYKLAWNVIGSGERTDLYAVVPDRRESQLARIPAADLRGLWGTFQPQVIAAVSASDAPVAPRGQEIWRTLAIAMLGLLVVESCFATWTGRQR
ncbi:MAG TPA: BatA domain-containing protein [Pirellulales bacterium]|nr:BatA domain-containing protein [Pirellulales bacterium]